VLRISVYEFKGAPPDSPLSYEFDERGGTIGRDASNQLALPDPERHMSRVQAEVRFVDGRYVLVDHGSNATTVNGHPVGKGNSVLLSDGDEIGIAFFNLRTEALRAAPQFAGGAAAAPTRSPVPVAAPAPAASGGADPLGLFATPAPSQGASLFGAQAAPTGAPPFGGTNAAKPAIDPFAELASLSAVLPPSSAKPVRPPATPTAASSAASDDPFAVFAAPAAKVEPAAPAAKPAPIDDPFAAFGARPKAELASASPLGLDLPNDPLGIGGGVESSSLDSLFQLDGKSASKDPFAGSALADPLFGGEALHTGSEDPLALLSGGAPATRPTERDDAPLMRESFVPPKVVQDQDLGIDLADEPMQPVAPATPVRPAGGVVSWEESAPAPTPPAPLAPAVMPAAAPEVVAASPTPIDPPAEASSQRHKIVVDGLEKPPLATVQPSATTQAPATAAAGADADTAELLNALARGLGVSGLKPAGGLTPEFMEHVGKMLREAAHGTIELLLARAVTKREVRAEMTMIVSKNNNPLKFSPDVNFALMQLIAPQGAGFMPPVEAMRDAYDDLRAHQIGFMAGMRGALTGVLARFKPEDLEARLSDKSFLDSVLPGGRKAKLWDMYEQRFADISREAEENFHSFFGREFLKAYEEQLDRLSNDRE
jgi:FHA domain-containing protein